MNIIALMSLSLFLSPCLATANIGNSKLININNEETFTITDKDLNPIESSDTTWKIDESTNELQIFGKDYILSGSYSYPVLVKDSIILSNFTVEVTDLEYALCFESGEDIYIDKEVNIINNTEYYTQKGGLMILGIDSNQDPHNVNIKSYSNIDKSTLNTTSIHGADAKIAISDSNVIVNSYHFALGIFELNDGLVNCNVLITSELTINGGKLRCLIDEYMDEYPILVISKKWGFGDFNINGGSLLFYNFRLDEEGIPIPACHAVNITLADDMKAYGVHNNQEMKLLDAVIGDHTDPIHGEGKTFKDNSLEPHCYCYVAIEKEGEHDLSIVEGLEPTCTSSGYKSCYRCDICLKYFLDIDATKEIVDYKAWIKEGGEGYLPALGHSLIKVDGKAPTCVDPGYKECYKCSTCNELFEDSGAKNKIRDYNEWISEGGSGYIAPHGHNYVMIEGKKPSYFEFGYHDYYQCSYCNKYFDDLDGEGKYYLIEDLEDWKLNRGKIDKLNPTWIIVTSVVGGAILIGGITAIIIYNKKKHKVSK